MEMKSTRADLATIPRPADEAQRLAALHQYQVLDSGQEPDYDLLAELAAQMCEAPYAFISLVDSQRVWYKSSHGLVAPQQARDQDYCSWTILEDELLHVPDLTSDVRTAQMALTVGKPGYRMYCGANLITADGRRLGALCVLDTRARQLSGEQQQMLKRLARLVVALLELRRRDRELNKALGTLQQLASEDVLTGLLNRRALMDALQREVERDQRFKTGLAVLMIDLDHFKHINDHHGHAMGDAVLRGVGRVLRAGLRAIDIAGRYGGEELCVLLPGTSLAGALTAAESLRRAIAAAQYRDGEAVVQITASIGVAATDQTVVAAADADALLRCADASLYLAKQSGRNQVMPRPGSAC
jgi:diguanylate cyclase (GGDEF)-like protein